MAKKITEYFKDVESFLYAIDTNFDFSKINGIGSVLSNNIKTFDYSEFRELLKYVKIKEEKNSNNSGNLNNLTFCITGSLNHFKNRDALVEVIESNGGKIGGVNSKLDYLINNDINSNSSKNRKAKELGIKIVTEEDFLKILS